MKPEEKKVFAAWLGMITLIIASVVFLSAFQNAGNTGTFTKAQLVFNAAGANMSSAIFQNIGQGAHYLTYCPSGFTGTIDLEESFDGSTNWVPIAAANPSNDSTCHVLQAGGYYQNVRSTITNRSGGTVSAWYSASSGPIQFASPGINSNGPTSPTQCDQSLTATIITTGTYSSLLADATGRPISVCGFTISFAAAPGSNTDAVQLGFGSPCGVGSLYLWYISTTASTPQVIPVGSGQGSIFRIGQNAGTNLCIGNHSGASLEISLSYALL